MLAVAIVSVAVSGVVAVAAIVAQLWQQRRGFAHERKLSDLEAVRGVMAHAAAVLHRMEYALDEAHVTLQARGAAFFENEKRAKPYETLKAAGREADVLKAQLRILFGPEHSVALTFDQANAAMLDAFRALKVIKMKDPAVTGTYAGQEVGAVVAEQLQRFATAWDNFGIAQGQFVDAAHVAGGAQLPSD